MALSNKAKAQFDTIKAAARSDQLALVECEEIGTNKKVSVLCSVWTENGVVRMEPLARLFAGNPYNQVAPPGEKAPRLI